MEWDKIIQHDVTQRFPLDDNSMDVVITSPPYWGLRDYGVDGQIGLESHPQEYIDKLVQISCEIRRVLKKTGSFYLNLGDTFYGSAQGYGASKKSKTGFQDVTKGFYAASHQKPPMLNKWPDDKWLCPKQLMGIPWRVAISLQEAGWILRNCIIWYKPNPLPSSVKDRLNTTYEFVFHFVKYRKYYYDLDAIREPHKSLLPAQKHIEKIYNIAKESERRTYNKKYTEDVKINARSVQEFIKTLRDTADEYKKKNVLTKEEEKAISEFCHNRSGVPQGKNPGDVITAKYKGQDVNPSEGHIRRGKELHDDFPPGYTGHPLGPGDFWNITTQPFTGYNPDLEHFAVFPGSLLLKPLKSSCPRYVCKKCGKPRTRIIETKNPSKEYMKPDGLYEASHVQQTSNRQTVASLHRNASPDGKTKGVYYSGKTVDWTDCGCNAGFDAGVVLDPFCGRGTVGKVAKQLGLHYILFDIKHEYCELARLYIGGQKHKLHRDQSKLGVINEI